MMGYIRNSKCPIGKALQDIGIDMHNLHKEVLGGCVFLSDRKLWGVGVFLPIASLGRLCGWLGCVSVAGFQAAFESRLLLSSEIPITRIHPVVTGRGTMLTYAPLTGSEDPPLAFRRYRR